MARASPIISSFNSGEFSPRLEGRVDIGKYPSASKRMENFIPLIQGPAMRRGGTRFVVEVKDSSKKTWLVKFQFNTQAPYQLEFGEKYIRFYTNHGQVQVSGVAAYNGATNYVLGDLVSSAGVNYYCILATVANAPPNATYWYPLTGTIYEIPSPYAATDLVDSNGAFQLRFVESADVVYMAHPSYAPRKLSRVGSTNWQISTLAQVGGPWKAQNVTSTTVYASAKTGTGITLTASSAIFQAGHVGSLFYLEQKDILSIAQWEAGKAVGAGVLRRSNGVNYLSVNAATTGGNKPVHSKGSVYDGDTGVQWTYQDPGYGYVKITGYTDSTHVTADVVSQIPDNATLVGNATTRWAFGAWSDVEGWPTQVSFFRERLTFGRGQQMWQSVAGGYEDFNGKDGTGNVVQDQAISLTLQSPQVNSLQWLLPVSDALICGTAGNEFSVRSLTENQPYGPDNVTAPTISELGSKNVNPIRIGDVILFVQRAGTKLRDVVYDYYSNKYQSIDQSVLAEHLPKPGIAQIVFQQEPYSLIWVTLTNGNLVCMTYSREQYPDPPHGGWHRHPIGGPGIVESISVTPSPAVDRDELWMIVQRTINGTTKRYIEYMEWERRPNDDSEDSFYVDCGLTLNNTIATTLTPGAGALTKGTTSVTFTAGAATFSAGDVGRELHYRYSGTASDGSTTYTTAKALVTAYTDTTHVVCTITAAWPSLALIASAGWRMTVTTISGLSYLEGQTVDILINGATHPQRVVSGGAITLQYPASKVQVGLPCPAKLQTLRLNAGAQDGTSQGKKARVSKVVIRLIETLGLQFGPNLFDATTPLDELNFRDANMAMDQPPALFTGDKELDWPGDWDSNPWLAFINPYPLPCTISAIMPQVSVSDRG